MALFQWRWLRRIIRKNTRPIPMDRAELWKRRLSLAYMFIAWQAFGFVCYMVYTGRNDWPKYYGFKSEEESKLTGASYYAKILNVEKGKIIRLSGISKVSEEDFEKENTSDSE